MLLKAHHLQIMGGCSKARLYLKYIRTLVEKTNLGRLAAPSLLILLDEAMRISSSRSYLNGRMSSETWDYLDQHLEIFGCFLVMDPNNPTSINSALRYWGCTIQAGAQVSDDMKSGQGVSKQAKTSLSITTLLPFPLQLQVLLVIRCLDNVVLFTFIIRLNLDCRYCCEAWCDGVCGSSFVSQH